MFAGIVILGSITSALAQNGVDLHAFQPTSTTAAPGDYIRVWRPQAFEAHDWNAAITYDF